jgi:hypothetical protein
MKKYSTLLIVLASSIGVSAQTTIESEGIYLIENTGAYDGYQQPTQSSYTLEYGKQYIFQVDGDYYITVVGKDMRDPKILGVGNNVFMFFDWDGWCKKYNQDSDSEFALAGYDSFKMQSGIYEIWAEAPQNVGDCGDINFVRMGSIEDYANRDYYDTVSVNMTLVYSSRKKVQKSSLNVTSGPWVMTMRTYTHWDYESTDYVYLPSKRLAERLGYPGCYAFYITNPYSSDDIMNLTIDGSRYWFSSYSAESDWTDLTFAQAGISVNSHTGNRIAVIVDKDKNKALIKTFQFNGTMIDFIKSSVSKIKAADSSDQTYSVSGIPGAQEGLIIKNGKTYYVK